MTELKILQYPDPRLKRKAVDVVDFNDEIKQVVKDMFETHYKQINCAALAATQLDLEPAWRITVIDYSPDRNNPLCLINPYLVEQSGEQFETEGCMSVYPSRLESKVKRALEIKVKAFDVEGRAIEIKAEGFLAKCIQHEIDHLDGKLYLDRLPALKRSLMEEKISKLRKKHLED